MAIRSVQKKRFPRLLDHDGAIALSKLMWHEPEFTLELDAHRRSIDFIFRVTLEKDSARHYSKAVDLLFQSSTDRRKDDKWKERLMETFRHAHSGEKPKKPILHLISTFLSRTHREALSSWVEDSWKDMRTACPDAKLKWKRGGSQPDPRHAVKIALRYEVVFEALKQFMSRLKKNGQSKPPRTLSEHRLRRALKANDYPTQFSRLAVVKISVSEVAKAYVKSEFERIEFSIGQPSFQTYLTSGRQLRKAIVRLDPSR